MQIETQRLALIDKGSNSEIYRYGNQEKSVVLKMVISSSRKECKHLCNQYRILSQLDHENIVKPIKYLQKTQLNSIDSKKINGESRNVLVMESAHHGNLLDFYKKYRPNPSQIRWIFSELAQALLYLHCNYFVHRDLKLENILVSENESQVQIKLSDFGFATSTKNGLLSNSYKGTPRGYMAPQINAVANEKNLLYDMEKADIFALGVIMFILVLGRFPFEFALPTNVHYKPIMEEKYQQFWEMHEKALSKYQESHSNFIMNFKKIFQRLIQRDSTKRPSIEEVLSCQWLAGKQDIIKSMKKTSLKK